MDRWQVQKELKENQYRLNKKYINPIDGVRFKVTELMPEHDNADEWHSMAGLIDLSSGNLLKVTLDFLDKVLVEE